MRVIHLKMKKVDAIKTGFYMAIGFGIFKLIAMFVLLLAEFISGLFNNSYTIY